MAIQYHKKLVLWIGPHFNSKGGVASVIKIYKEEGFFNDSHIQLISTVKDGNKLKKILIFFKAFYIFLRRIRQAKLIHVHLSCGPSFWRKSIFILVSCFFNVPIIIHLHASSFPNYYTNSSTFVKNYINRCLSKSNHLFVLSYEIQSFIKQLPLKLNPLIFPNPVIIKSTKPNVNTNELSILYLGRITKEKGIEELVKATSIVKHMYPSIKLVVGGDGKMELLQTLVKKYQIEDNIKILGWIDKCEREIILQSCTMLVLPSYGEGQSMSILEAMESYLPVISTNAGGTTFLIENGVSGLLVPAKDSEALANAIQTLLLDTVLKDKMVMAARKKVEDIFDSKKIINQVIDIYHTF